MKTPFMLRHGKQEKDGGFLTSSPMLSVSLDGGTPAPITATSVYPSILERIIVVAVILPCATSRAGCRGGWLRPWRPPAGRAAPQRQGARLPLPRYGGSILSHSYRQLQSPIIIWYNSICGNNAQAR